MEKCNLYGNTNVGGTLFAEIDYVFFFFFLNYIEISNMETLNIFSFLYFYIINLF